jgi:hypothetical protein
MNRPEDEPSMSRGPATFKRRDVTSVVLAAGYEVAGVEFDPVTRKVRVLTRNDKNAPTIQKVEIDENEWDAWVAERHNKPSTK